MLWLAVDIPVEASILQTGKTLSRLLDCLTLSVIGDMVIRHQNVDGSARNCGLD